MDSSPELWAFILANTGLFLVSSVLTILSYVAYRQSNGRSSYLITTVGFGIIGLGGLVEPVYQLLVRGDSHVNGTELMWLQAGEGILIAGGLGLLFYAITRYDSRSSSTTETTYRFGPQDSDD